MNPNILTVSAINRYLKNRLENDHQLKNMLVSGELSNVKYYPNGHVYFTLKDDTSRISGVMWSTYARRLPFKLEDGGRVILTCDISLYVPSGNYQLNCKNAQLDGLGNLYLAYEALKKKLQEEGLFDESHKKPIPNYPMKVAIITASTGAAIHDITRTIHNNNPTCKMVLYPSLVQGEGSAKQLLQQLLAADHKGYDCIIIGRGGGSLEDLWSFNDETLARAIYHAKTPIISAVGHESDFTICDFVADKRAATPTAAGELASFDAKQLSEDLNQYALRFYNAIHHASLRQTNQLEHHRQVLQLTSSELVLKQQQLLTTLTSQMQTHLQQSLKVEGLNVLSYQHYFSKHATSALQQQHHQLDKYVTLMKEKIHLSLKQQQFALAKVAGQLDALSPLATLSRGYTLTYQNDRPITSKQQLDYQLPLKIQYKDGMVTTIIQEDNNDE